MTAINEFIGMLNGYLFHEYVVYALLFTGVLFTFWSGFCQFRALTHGVKVVRGHYEEAGDPGAITHFQALSAALSATVGLGNIGGVAVAVAVGGPGAVLWMWVIGFVGMALKVTEVTQSMIFRNTEDPDNPHGGPMFVVKKGFAEWGAAGFGWAIGAVFVFTLIISAITGGNMFQAWNVADVTYRYFGVPQVGTGIVLSLLVGSVIIGGIKRIGSVAGRIVPFMCGLYLMAAAYVLMVNVGEIPAMFGMIFAHGLPSWLGGQTANPSGAFLGGTFGYAAMWGIKRALFSSEAGQGSAPIAHSAAKTHEPAREGVVAGLEPFIDTLVVCTMTALVILSTGAWNRGPEAEFEDSTAIVFSPASGEASAGRWSVARTALPPKNAEAKRVTRAELGSGWRSGEQVFVLVYGPASESTGASVHRLTGIVSGNEQDGWFAEWGSIAAAGKPSLAPRPDGSLNRGVYVDYAGASLTAHAFDRAAPGLGMWLVTFASWLFALSTMISWSYYGEQGVVYLAGEKGVLPYKLIYCALIVVSTLGFITTDHELDMWTTLGLGVMLVANIPIMLVFGPRAMKVYHEYIDRVKRGEI